MHEAEAPVTQTAINLCVVWVHIWAKIVTMYQWNKVGSVQQEEDRAENRPLRYTTVTTHVQRWRLMQMNRFEHTGAD